MSDIIDPDINDKDTIGNDELQQQFSKKYGLMTEKAVSLQKSYINKLSCNDALKLAVGLSDRSIEVYKLDKNSLTKECRLSGHAKALTEVVMCPDEDHLIYSAGHDGVLKLWDTRSSGTCALEYKDEEDDVIRPYECMDVSSNGRVLCAGSQVVQDDAYLVFWDQRMTKPLGGYWNSHTDDITQVKFHKQKTEILATGALDGLLNVFNILEPNEDDALTYSLNVENSVETLRWLDDKRISCITQSNDLQLWDTKTGDLTKNYDRDKISRSIKRSKGDDCYLVDTFTTIEDTPVLLAGSLAGNGQVLRSVSITEKRLQPCTSLALNKQIVRCCHYDKHRDFLITAGESGIISVWSAAPSKENGATTKKLSNSLNKLHVNRHKPY